MKNVNYGESELKLILFCAKLCKFLILQKSVKKTLTWAIEGFTRDFVNKFKKGERIQSSDFSLLLGKNKTNWNLWFFPNGYSTQGVASIYLAFRSSTSKNFNCFFNSALKTNDNSKQYSGFSRNIDEYKSAVGRTEFFKLKEMFLLNHLFLTNDVLTLALEIELSENIAKDVPERCCSRIALNHFEEMFNRELFSDFTLIASDGQEIQAHKAVIAARCSTLETMLKAGMRESHENRVAIKDTSFKVLKEFIRFIYSEKVVNLEEIAEALFVVAHKYNVPELRDKCSQAMIQNVNAENVIDRLILANCYNENQLKYSCIFFISKQVTT